MTLAGCGQCARRPSWLGLLLLAAAMALAWRPAVADEGGASVWLPGTFGSLVATPVSPGWSLPLVYYHASQDANGTKEFPIGGRIAAGVDVRSDLLLASPTYAFREPVLGGQLALSVTALLGDIRVSADATLAGPGGNALTRSESDSTTGGGDLFPQATLRWNRGNHNFMAYAMADVPVGAYEEGRLANIGLNHWAIDGGGGYTYLDEKTGREFSIAAGMTHNFENPATDYRNGVDFHLGWGLSQFLSPKLQAGLAGYWYQQITGDSGAGAVLGPFKSRVGGIGPQVGYLFNADGRQWYVNLKGYWEFEARNRPSGWKLWMTCVVPLSKSPAP